MFNVDFDLRSAVKAHQPITEAEEEFLADLPEDDEEFFYAFVDNARDHGAVSCWVTLGRGEDNGRYYEFGVTDDPDYEASFMDRFPDYQGINFESEDIEPLFYVPVIYFFGMYMVDVNQYGEDGEQFGPFWSLKEARESFEYVLTMYLP